ncbi:MBL fold metallo-hydrolase [Clostridium ljungdahlii]|uniref:Putative metallo-hydrolase YycJ n=1 Tax=Clostridium ljungdahlii TaxID=1538 RepID=A0A162L3V9_9CLOT|nr:MBL fold metallo-hydrolase [Clostridium ljungdahlii]OAA90772.1 putative metallo-hydrolase YycJ [Clostridium ljungdahlii]
MKLKVLGSGSAGNCYLLQNENETLMLECGLSYRTILKGLNFNVSDVAACLITHEHRDHCKAIKDIIKAGIDIYTGKGTIDFYGMSGYRVHSIRSEEQFAVGDFTVMPFKTDHDAVEPLGFLIYHNEIGRLLFITDSYYCRYKFSGITHIMIECNYDVNVLNKNIENGTIPYKLRNRIIKSHFSLENVKEFLSETDLSEVREITLLHLSGDNSDEKMFIEEIEKLTGKPVYAADEGLELELL